MKSFWALVWLYVLDLRRRRLVWVLALLAIAGAALQYWTMRQVAESIAGGETYGLATKRAGSRLDELADSIRGWDTVFVVLLAAQVAPESRRSGTTQFVLSAGVPREVLAAVQFTALAALVVAGSIVAHVGFSVAGVSTGAMAIRDVTLAWVTLTGPWLALSAAVFSFSLTASAIESYILFFGGPLLAGLPAIIGGMPMGTPAIVTRALENVGLLFPSVTDLMLWPHLSAGGNGSLLASAVGGRLLHSACGLVFWVILGLWLHRKHDFGSRAAVR